MRFLGNVDFRAVVNAVIFLLIGCASISVAYSANLQPIIDLPSHCGTLENAYGPFDYTNPVHRDQKLGKVDRAHFTPKVANLIEGQASRLAVDIDYTLRAFPNHHRALYAMSRYQLNLDRPILPPRRNPFPIECYFQRAMVFAPNDGVVRMLYGMHLHKAKKFEESEKYYREALAVIPNSSELHNNVGLLYYDTKNFEKAVMHAKKASELGYPLPGLRDRLKSLGEWPTEENNKPELENNE